MVLYLVILTNSECGASWTGHGARSTRSVCGLPDHRQDWAAAVPRRFRGEHAPQPGPGTTRSRHPAPPLPPGPRHRRPAKPYADKGIESSHRLGRHRWVVERSVSWLAGCRRLHRRYERKAEHSALRRHGCSPHRLPPTDPVSQSVGSDSRPAPAVSVTARRVRWYSTRRFHGVFRSSGLCAQRAPPAGSTSVRQHRSRAARRRA